MGQPQRPIEQCQRGGLHSRQGLESGGKQLGGPEDLDLPGHIGKGAHHAVIVAVLQHRGHLLQGSLLPVAPDQAIGHAPAHLLHAPRRGHRKAVVRVNGVVQQRWIAAELLGTPAREPLNASAHIEDAPHRVIPLPDHLIEGIGQAGELAQGGFRHPPQSHQLGDIREGDDGAETAAVAVAVGHDLCQVGHLLAGGFDAAPLVAVHHRQQGVAQPRQRHRGGHADQRLAHIAVHQSEHPHRQRRETADAQLAIHDHHPLAQGALDVLEIVVEVLELIAAGAQLLIHTPQLLVGGLQLLV